MDQGKLIFLKLNPNSPRSFWRSQDGWGKKKPLNTETLEILIFQEKRSTFKNAEHGYWYIIIMIHDYIIWIDEHVTWKRKSNPAACILWIYMHMLYT